MAYFLLVRATETYTKSTTPSATKMLKKGELNGCLCRRLQIATRMAMYNGVVIVTLVTVKIRTTQSKMSNRIMPLR